MATITQIEIDGFKAFPKNFKLDLGTGKNLLLYGENGSGKSSLYYALHALLQSVFKDDKGAKYFNPGDTNGAEFVINNEHLINIFRFNEAKDNTYTPYVRITFDDGKIWRLDNGGLSSENGGNESEIRMLNKNSAFINHSYISRFHAARNSEEIDLWNVFYKDILPFHVEELDRKNPEKERLNFHPLGQGRLAIVYFADSAEYETVYRDDSGKYNKRTIPYPSTSEGLFTFSEYEEKEIEVKNNTYTKLTILINKQQSLGRAKTFFKSYSTHELFKQWFIETFFPFIISNETLVINISFNGNSFTIKKNSIEAETQKEPFELSLSYDNKYSFILWLIKNSKPMHRDNPIICFARNLRASFTTVPLKWTNRSLKSLK